MSIRDVNLEILTRDELLELHDKITDRLQFLESVASQAALQNLRLGQTVQFDAGPDGIQKGILIRRNIKTATVLVGDKKWRVSPQLLKTTENKKTINAENH